ncbi:DNA repair protein RecO [Aerococcaceae bacterium DSM 111020]|nr:DNA repair protein RecO [Aerococcaceae bacterium DSM 111020]
MNESFEGIVLFKRPYRDLDALVKIFTQNYGTKMFFVKALNKPNHSLNSHTLPLTKHSYIGTINQDSLSFLKEANTLNMYRQVQMDPVIQAYAVYASQLVDAACPDNEPRPEIYQLLSETLNKLDQHIAPEIIIAYIELRLLPEFGTYFNFEHCLYCQTIQGPFDMSIRQMGLLCPRHYHQDSHRMQTDPNAIYILQHLQRLSLEDIQNVSLSPQLLAEIRRLMDAIYDEYVGLRLKSKSYLNQLTKMEQEINKLKNSREKSNKEKAVEKDKTQDEEN